jgi:hypothetical protein
MERVAREAMKERVLATLKRLRAEFPLEERVGALPARTRGVYAQILQRWVRTGQVPQGADFPPEELEELAALDAIALTEPGIGCYPFSAKPTGIRVSCAGNEVFAMCALDALAIPRLTHSPGAISAQCHGCGAPIHVVMNSDGSLPHDSPNSTHVIYRELARAPRACCEDLCPGINFLCGECGDENAGSLTLPEAAAVAHAFFSFQGRLLRQPW